VIRDQERALSLGIVLEISSMQLPTTAEYALRATSYLAGLPEGEAVQAKVIAKETGVPPAYLSKVLRRLTVAGLLVAQKGHGGGFSLAYVPADISFAEVLAAVGLPLDEKHCAFGWKACDPDHPCPLHPAWSSLKVSLLAWANETSLGDVSQG
tara:strand:+ start:2305 stop:2763 length:459 start_codon:yes stop_codon:yes gene_type:complete